MLHPFARPCCMLLYVIAQSLKPVKLFSQQLPTFLLFRDRRSVAQQCWILLHSSSNIVEATHAHYAWFTKIYGLYPSHDALQVPKLFGVVASVHLDCKTVSIFAYSSKREQSNKRSGTRLKTESETGERRFFSLASHALRARVRLVRHALPISLLEKKADCPFAHQCQHARNNSQTLLAQQCWELLRLFARSLTMDDSFHFGYYSRIRE